MPSDLLDKIRTRKTLWRRVKLWALAGLILLVATLNVGLWWLGRIGRQIVDLEGRYERVQRGMTRETVKEIMGDDVVPVDRPDSGTARWDGRQLDASQTARIRSVLRYHVERTGWIPVTWEFTFDEQGEVVGKHCFD